MTPADKRQLTVKIDDAIFSAVHKERLEAFLQRAHAIYVKRRKAPLLAVINRNGIAAVFNRAKEQAYLVPASELTTDEETAADIKYWLSAPDGPYFVLEFEAD